MFTKGVSGNPAGRPKGVSSGRVQAVATLDRFLAQKKTQLVLTRWYCQELREHPGRFFKDVVMPLLPKEAKVAMEHAGVVQWQSLLGVGVEKTVGQTGGDAVGQEDRSQGK